MPIRQPLAPSKATKFIPDQKKQKPLEPLKFLLKSAEVTTVDVASSALEWKLKPPDEAYSNILSAR